MAYGCLMECIPLAAEAVNTHREKPKVNWFDIEIEFEFVFFSKNCRSDRTVSEALNEFFEEPIDTNKVHTKSEILYRSSGTKIQTVDIHGNEMADYVGDANTDPSFI